jgi:hypothetical protein
VLAEEYGLIQTSITEKGTLDELRCRMTEGQGKVSLDEVS